MDAYRSGMTKRTCLGVVEGRERCRQAPLRGEDYCFWHHADHAQEAADARRMGGLRRRREHTLKGAYEIDGLESVEQIRRVLEIALLDALGLENNIPRVRALIAGALAAAKLHETGEVEERLEAIEAALGPRSLPSERARRQR